MTKATRTLALLLTVCMLLSCMSVFVSAESMIGDITVSPITEMNELNARAAINTYFAQRKAFLTGAAEELPMANDPLEADEAKHLAALTEAGLTVVDSTVVFGDIRYWDNYAEVKLTETVTFSQNGATTQEAVDHIVLIRLDDQGNYITESDGYRVQTASFVSACYVDPNAVEPLAATNGSDNCIIHVAGTQIGVTENADGWNKYGAAYDAYYGTTSFAYSDWCASFVFWCARNSGISNSVIPYYASCTLIKDWFSARGKFYGVSKTPQAGDLILLNGTQASPDHIGIITSVSSYYIYYIDGNNGGAVTSNTISRTATNIIGYCRPAYVSSNHSATYAYNATQHWQDCTACSYIGSKTAHIYNSGSSTCTVCGYAAS